jgi:signal transduction histidine kinase
LNSESQAGSAPSRTGSRGPLLIECDRQARIVWMSEDARSSFGPASNFFDTMRAAAPSEPAALLSLASPAKFSPVFQRGDSVWISAELADRPQLSARPVDLGLLGVQSDFVRNYFRLQTAERRLSSRARNRRRTPAASAVMQIERERQRLARELHTGVGQILSAIRLQLEIIASQHGGLPPQVAQALTRIGTLADEALGNVRSVSSRLHPPEWQRLALTDALRRLWDLSGIPQRFEASARIEPLSVEPALEIKVLVYRATQEALSNLVRHSHATRVDLSLETRENRIILTVRDNGVGFDPASLRATPAAESSGIGLRTIREQAAALNAVCSIDSGPEGTCLHLSAPHPGEDSQ